MNTSSAFGGIARALRHPGYRAVWIGHGISTTGRWMHLVASGWLVWELTGSSTWLGFNAFAYTFPTVIFPLIAGVFADRVGFLRMTRTFVLVMAVIATLFAALTFAGLITVEMVLVLSALLGSAQALATPSQLALVNSLLPKPDLAAGVALMSATFNASRFVGPAIAGALIIWFSIALVLALHALAQVVFFVILLNVTTSEDAETEHRPAGFLADLAEALAYARDHGGIRFLLVLLAVTGLVVRPYIDLLPGVSAEMFAMGADGLSILLSATGAGAMCAAVWLARRGRTEGLSRIVMVSLLGSALTLMVFVSVHFIWAGAAVLFFTGFFIVAGTISTQTLIQSSAAAHVRGRVMSLFVVISWGFPAVGAVVMGWAATAFGLAGVIGLGAGIAFLVWIPARRRAGRVAGELEAP